MEMIDVLQKLKEIAESKPELVKDAVENVERTNPKAVTEGGMKDYLHDEAEKLSREEFIKKHGESLAGFWDSINGTEEAVEGKMPAGLKAYQDKKAGKENKDVPAGSHKMPDGTIMKDKDHKKEEVKESIQISADTPQEASMMMQILALAGVKPVDAAMIGAEEPAADHGTDGDEMAKFRNMVTAPDEEKAQETFANEPEEKVADIDTLVNVHSGGLNRRKQQFAKAQDGDNAMAVAQEDKITEQELANSLRTQYESFKSAYQTEAKKAKPDFLDMDKDGDKKEPMKKAITDKEAK
jgi:hypothetical protein